MSDHMLKVERKLSDAFLDKLMKKAPTVYGVSDWFSVPYQEDGIHWHRLDIHFPTEQHHSLPAILYLHGGGWSTGDKAFFRHYCRTLAQAGYVVFNANYRLVPDYRHPAQVLDAIAAARWVLDHGADFGADTGRFFLAGDSAGAHLAAITAALCTNPEYAEKYGYTDRIAGIRPTGVLLLCGAFDMQTALKSKFPRIRKYVQGLLDIRKPQKLTEASDWDEISPLRHITKDFPPTFITDAEPDRFIEENRAMIRKLGQMGVEHDALLLGAKDGALLHDYQVEYFTAAFGACMEAVLHFLKKTARMPEDIFEL